MVSKSHGEAHNSSRQKIHTFSQAPFKKELLEGRYVDREAEQPHVCSPISVVSSGSGKKRLVVNLRHVNQTEL